MLARMQRLATVALIAAAFFWMWGWMEAGHPVWAAVGALCMLCSQPIALAIEFMLVRRVHGRDPAPRPSTAALWRAWAEEVCVAAQVFNWRQPFRSARLPDTVRRPSEAAMPDSPQPAVVLVHGFVCNRGFWLPLLSALRRHGVAYATVNLEPVFAASLDDYRALVEQLVERACQATGQPPIIVAHSMGGVVVRAWLADERARAVEQARPVRVRHVVTIGSPHAGTWLARWNGLAMVKQMRQGSPWLAELDAAERTVADRCAPPVPWTCFFSNCDNVVMPPSAATLPDADNRLLAGSGHVAQAFRPEVLQEILRLAGHAAAAS